MEVAGFITNSFVDYPGKIASVVFLGGCDFRCYYCHNYNIFNNNSNTMDFYEILEKIREQVGFIDGVVITGGEPTLHSGLFKMIPEIRKLGLLVKLDTNGTSPGIMEKVVNDGLVDYVAMDIKGPLEKYRDLAGVTSAETIANVTASITFLKGQDKVPYMFRMTLAPMLNEADIRRVAALVKGAKCFQLQQFVPNEFSNSHKTVLLPYTPDQAVKFGAILSKHVGEFLMRGF